MAALLAGVGCYIPFLLDGYLRTLERTWAPTLQSGPDWRTRVKYRGHQVRAAFSALTLGVFLLLYLYLVLEKCGAIR